VTGLQAIVTVRSGDEELRRVRALAGIYETTPNAVIREVCGFFLSHAFLSHAIGTPRCRQVAGAGRDQQRPVSGHQGWTCLACQMEDPPSDMTCTLGRDHRVGVAGGCPGCGRLTAACAARPCSATRVQKGTP
jgi:hypothetical protein